MLKLIAVPLIVASLIKGISDLKDFTKFAEMGLRTVALYITTTIFAITIGLAAVNFSKPGENISKQTIEKLKEKYVGDEDVQKKIAGAKDQKKAGPLKFIEDMVPDNAFRAMSDNKLMLQVIFFTIMLGISLLLIKEDQAKPLKDFFDSLNEVVLKMVDLIMLSAPYAVFALLSSVIVSAEDPDLIVALAKYAGTVIVGLVVMIAFYMLIVCIFRLFFGSYSISSANRARVILTYSGFNFIYSHI